MCHGLPLSCSVNTGHTIQAWLTEHLRLQLLCVVAVRMTRDPGFLCDSQTRDIGQSPSKISNLFATSLGQATQDKGTQEEADLSGREWSSGTVSHYLPVSP